MHRLRSQQMPIADWLIRYPISPLDANDATVTGIIGV